MTNREAIWREHRWKRLQRAAGLCVACPTGVPTINPRTGQLFHCCLACRSAKSQQDAARYQGQRPQRYLPRQQRPVAGDLAPHVIDAIYEQARQRQRRARWSA